MSILVILFDFIVLYGTVLANIIALKDEKGVFFFAFTFSFGIFVIIKIIFDFKLYYPTRRDNEDNY